jgi:hypothetical protein
MARDFFLQMKMARFGVDPPDQMFEVLASMTLVMHHCTGLNPPLSWKGISYHWKWPKFCEWYPIVFRHDHLEQRFSSNGLARCRIPPFWMIKMQLRSWHVIEICRIPRRCPGDFTYWDHEASIPSTHRTEKKGGWDEPAECPSKSHHCCRCWGGTSATECGKRARKREVMALLGWAKVIREWLPTMRGVWSSWKKTDCNYEDSPYHFWMTFGEFRCLVLRRVAVYNLKIRIATTLSSIHQLTTSLQMHCRKDFAVWNSEKMSFREDRVVPICSISS